jgi:D-alanyl-D-alanine-carboxypeptidase/D-alanyl-D-alanine-endopeptidase
MKLADVVCVLGILLFTVAVADATQKSDTTLLPSDTEIRDILIERIHGISNPEDGVGIVVGVIGPQGRRIISYGHLNESLPMDGDTVFEIGSVTKVFTGLLLADMAHKGEVAFEDPVAKYLPTSVKIPVRNGRSITLLDLATHTSSLPFMPDQSGASKDLYAENYSEADLYQFLSGYDLPYGIGTRWEYSNMGYWLLSEALAFRASSDYENLLRLRVIAPMKLVNTDFTLSSKMKVHLAIGHDAVSQPSPAMSTLKVYSIMSAAGSLFSTVNDLLTFLSIALKYQHSKLAESVALSVRTHRPASQPGEEQALGWTIFDKDQNQLIFRDGGTFGYSSCVVLDPEKRVGVVVLSNHVTSVSDIGRHILRSNFPLEHPTVTKHKEIKLDSATLDSYVGRYEAPGEGVFSIVREGDVMMIEAPDNWGIPKLRIHPESAKEFFVSELPMRVTFQTDDAGHVSGILVYPPRGQKSVPAQRIK